MFNCIADSISGDIKTTIFAQAGNLPDHEDGIALFKSLTEFTPVATTQLSIMSLQNIIEFDPTEYDFKIPDINAQLANLFVLATTGSRTLAQTERISHALNVYSKIQRLEL